MDPEFDSWVVCGMHETEKSAELVLHGREKVFWLWHCTARILIKLSAENYSARPVEQGRIQSSEKRVPNRVTGHLLDQSSNPPYTPLDQSSETAKLSRSSPKRTESQKQGMDFARQVEREAVSIRISFLKTDPHDHTFISLEKPLFLSLSLTKNPKP